MKTAIRRPDLPRRAVLVRRRAVGIAELGRNGCRLETNAPFAIGDIGMLAVDIQGERRVEMFRVARVTSVSGHKHLFEAGVEFLPLTANPASLQDVVVQFEADTPAS